MAVLQVGDQTLCFATDTLLEGTHFDFSTATAKQVGYKALAVNLSDCAAMASRPIAAVVALSTPRGIESAVLDELHAGLHEAAQQFDCPLVGGDTTSWTCEGSGLALTVSVLSAPIMGSPVLRRGALPGDAILVTGELGGSLSGKHLNFTPRLAEVALIAQRAAIHAMIDISDGLSQDLNHLCRAGQVHAVIDSGAIPLSNAARATADPLAAALGDGEDFELLFTVSTEDCDTLLRDWKSLSKTRLNCIGQILPADSDIPDGQHRLYLRDPMSGRIKPLKPKGWEHPL